MTDEPVLTVITRAHNRLEYTVQCLACAKHNLGVPFEHIVINQASRDGTREWLDHITNEIEWYSHVRVVHLDNNIGDMEGMKLGAKMAEGEILMQLDNDALILQPNTAPPMIELLERDETTMAVSIYRECVRQRLRPKNEHYTRIKLDGQWYLCGIVRVPVMCYVIRKAKFMTMPILGNCGNYPRWETWKIYDLKALHIEGYNPAAAGINWYLQRHKYIKGRTASDPKPGPPQVPKGGGQSD